MKLIRGILLGLLLWLSILIEISITIIGFNLPNLTVWIIHYIFLIPITILVAWLYYKSKDKVNGFLLGLIFVATGIILDAIITVPLFIIPQGGNYLTYFTNTYLLIGLAEAVIIAGVYGMLRKKKKH